MSRSKEYKVMLRAVIDYVEVDDLLQELVPSHQSVWLSKTEKCRVCHFLGVRGKDADVLVPEQYLDYIGDRDADCRLAEREEFIMGGSLIDDGIDVDGHAKVTILEVGHKTGRFDGNTRVRFSLRLMRRDSFSSANIRNDASVSFRFERETEDPKNREFLVSLIGTGAEGSEVPEELFVLEWRFRQWRTEINNPEDIGRIVRAHAQSYYRHLPREEVDRLATTFVPTRTTLNELNREVSRALYALSRELGWHKLTTKQRKRLDWEGAQWVDEATYGWLRSRAGLESPTGCGEFTLTAARSEPGLCVLAT